MEKDRFEDAHDSMATNTLALVTEFDVPQIMDLTSNNVSADGEEDSEPVDITMWTQQRVVIKSSQSPQNLCESIDHMTATLPQTAAPHDLEIRRVPSPSPETINGNSFAATDKTSGTNEILLTNDISENTTASTTEPLNRDKYCSPSPDLVDEIPFAAPDKTAQAGETSETITVPIMSSDIKQEHSPLEIKFIEGPQELREIPHSLYTQLRTFCQNQGTNWPTCVRSKWPPTLSLFWTLTGNRSWFENPRNGETLLAARYSYGKKGQIVVVKQQPRSTSNFNQGKPAIVLHSNTSTDQITKDNLTIIHTSWQVWHPSPNGQTPIYVRRTIEVDRTTKSSVPKPPKTIFKTPSTTEFHKNAAESASRSARSEPVSQEDATAYAIRRHQKRPSFQDVSDDERGRPTKRPRTSSHTINPNLLKADYPKSGSLGARRDQATGEILLRRKADGKLIMLRCTECDYKQCESQQGLLNHFRTSHNIDYSTHDQMQDAIAIEIDEKSGAYSINSEPKSKHVAVGPSESPPPRRVSRRLATPPQSATPHGDWDIDDPDEPDFVFSKGIDDSNPRIRPVRTINSAEKLFVHALAAGVAKKDTLMLTVAINNRKPIQIVRGDNEDFRNVVHMIRKSKVSKTVAVVTVEDLDI